MSDTLSSQMRELAPLAFEMVGIPANPDSLDVSDGRDPHAVAASADGLLDLKARFLSRYDCMLSSRAFYRRGGPDCFYWRGLVRADEGVFEVDEYSLVVGATTSPRGYNKVQRTLGRTPGSDAFELVRSATAEPHGHFTAAEYTSAFANKKVLCADLTVATQFMAEHDVNPRDHAASWLCSSPAFCSDVANRAGELVRKHGDRLYDGDNPPSESALFAEGMDKLSRTANGLLELVSGLAESPEYDDARPGGIPDLAALDRALEPQPASEFDPTFVPDMQRLLELIGLITPSMTKIEAKQRSAATVADRICHISGLLLTLEEVAPLESDTAADRNRRVDTLRAIQRATAQS